MTDYDERYSYELLESLVIIHDRYTNHKESYPLQMLNQIVKKAKALQKVRTI